MGPREVAEYLETRGYLTTEDIVSGRITIEDASRRNLNMTVSRPRGTCYFVKQAQDADAAGHLAHEASIYKLLRSDVRQDSFSRYVPRFLGYDANRHVLVLEFIRKSRTLREHHARRRHCPAALGAAVGRALAGLHRLSIAHDPGLRGSHDPPWIFTLHRPGLRHWRGFSSASLQVIEIIQGSPEFCRLLDELHTQWRADAFVHFDAKWDNWIIREPSAAEYSRTLRLVDWELAGPGDRAWDLASVLAEYLNLWRSSLPLLEHTMAPETVEAASRLERMQPAMRAFWTTYVRCMPQRGAASELLIRTARYTAVRLLQTSIERAQASPQLSSTVVGNLQLTLSILQRPVEAVVHLFGITFPEAAG